MHWHQCSFCSNMWQHADSMHGDVPAHTCKKCGNQSWWKADAPNSPPPDQVLPPPSFPQIFPFGFMVDNDGRLLPPIPSLPREWQMGIPLPMDVEDELPCLFLFEDREPVEVVLIEEWVEIPL